MESPDKEGGFLVDKIFKVSLRQNKAICDIAIGALLVIASVFMLTWGSQNLYNIGFGSVGIVNDKLFPNIIMAVTLVNGLAILALGFADLRMQKAGKKEAAFVEISIYALVVAIIGVFFTKLMKVIGYPLCNVIAMYAVYFMLRGKKPIVGLAVGVIFTACSYLFFAKYLGVILPIGFGM